MINRRKLLLGTAVSGVAALGGYAWISGRSIDLSNLASRPRLKMPPLIDTATTGKLNLTAMNGETKFWRGMASQTTGYNQSYLGPVFRVSRGTYQTKITNQTAEDISVHWHGLKVPGDVDGGPHTPVRPGNSWTRELVIDQEPSTPWYHTHIHRRTATGVHGGLAGGMIISDGRDDQTGLPSAYGVDDLYLVLQDRNFSSNGRMIYDLGMMGRVHGFSGDTMVVNGQIGTVAAVPKGIVRLRLLNGSNARIYRLQFSDARPMHLIATDNGYLPEPRQLNDLRLSPGERAEVLIDFADGNPVALTSLSDPNSGAGGMMGRFQSVAANLVGLQFEVLAFSTDEQVEPRITAIPDKLDGSFPDLKGQEINERSFSLDMGMGGGMMGGGMMDGAMAINGRSYDMSRIDFEVKLGTVERWVVSASTLAHPFHVHGVAFQVVSENGGPPSPENQGWKDTVLINQNAELLIKFEKLAPRGKPFMYHCHVLEHEDQGMMGQFTVI